MGAISTKHHLWLHSNHRSIPSAEGGPVAGNSRERGQSVASRLLRVLDAFSAERPELGLADISRTTGLPPATLYRLLRELTDHGAIQRTSTGRYAVGVRLWEIGRLAPTVSRLDEVAIPYLEDLYEATCRSTTTGLTSTRRSPTPGACRPL